MKRLADLFHEWWPSQIELNHIFKYSIDTISSVCFCSEDHDSGGQSLLVIESINFQQVPLPSIFQPEPRNQVTAGRIFVHHVVAAARHLAQGLQPQLQQLDAGLLGYLPDNIPEHHEGVGKLTSVFRGDYRSIPLTSESSSLKLLSSTHPVNS